jgi:hypothetical protein
VSQLVLERIRTHPLLQPLRDAGITVFVGCHEDAIFARALFRGRGEYELDARSIYPEWWEPFRDTREEWALKLAGRLARNLRAQWDAWATGSPPSAGRGIGTP